MPIKYLLRRIRNDSIDVYVSFLGEKSSHIDDIAEVGVGLLLLLQIFTMLRLIMTRKTLSDFDTHAIYC